MPRDTIYYSRLMLRCEGIPIQTIREKQERHPYYRTYRGSIPVTARDWSIELLALCPSADEVTIETIAPMHVCARLDADFEELQAAAEEIQNFLTTGLIMDLISV